MDSDKKRQGIQSIEVGFRILKCLEDARKPLSVSELCKRLNMSGSKIHKYLVSYCRIGMLEQNEKDSSYSLGSQLITLGLAALERVDVAAIAMPQLLEINQQLNDTVALSVWGENGPYFIKWLQSNRLINIGINVGSYVPLTTSATGKVFASFLQPEKSSLLLEREIKQNGINKEQFHHDLNEIRQNGYAYTNGGLIPGVAAVSAPIFDHDGQFTAAITIIGSIGLIHTEPNSSTVLLLKKAAETISGQLSFGRQNGN